MDITSFRVRPAGLDRIKLPIYILYTIVSSKEKGCTAVFRSASLFVRDPARQAPFSERYASMAARFSSRRLR